MHKKDLHLGKCLDDLKPFFESVDKSTIKNKSLAKWVWQKKCLGLC